MKSFSPKRRDAFTLIELLVVISIIALLAAILFPVFSRARDNARRSTCQSNLKQIGLAITQYTQDFDEKYPIDAGNDNSTFDTSILFNTFSWTGKVQPYLKSKQVFICPSTTPNPSNPAGTRVDQCLSYWVPAAMFVKFNSNNDPFDYEAVGLTSIFKPTEIPQVYENLNGLYEPRRIARPYWGTNSGGVYALLTSKYQLAGSFTANKAGVHFDGSNVLYADGHVKWKKNAALYQQLCPEWSASNPNPSDCTAATQIQ